MKNNYVFLMCLMWLSFSSCLTVNRIERNCDKFAKICVTPISTSIEYRDTTVYIEKSVYVDKIIRVPIPGHTDTLRITDTVRIVGNYAFMKPIHKEIGIIGVDASIFKSVFSIDAYLTDSSFLYNYIDTLSFRDSVTIANAIRDRTTSNTIVLPPEKYIPGIYKFAFWVVITEVILLVLIALGWFGVLKIPRIKLPRL